MYFCFKLFFWLIILSVFPLTEVPSQNILTEASKDTSTLYINPKTFSFIKNIPMDIVDYGKITFKKKNLLNITAMTAATIGLVLIDQNITDQSKKFGKWLNIDGNSSQKAYAGLDIEIFSTRTFVGFEGPHDLSSAMYFLGDGWTTIGIAGGFLTHGLITKRTKSRCVASAVIESMLASGIVVQLLKHISGRESPFVATAPGGLWKPFPNQIDYHRNVPHYDAFPSGHAASAMGTIIVLSEFYPENRLIRPIGYSLMGILLFSMLNNGVHWASDYPLGIALGYSFGKIAATKYKKKVS
ncbi:MAG: phosphatase PAP2 family protein [Bacteroidia bacterium]|nr:phosphatase PAP2 family protein [Bacteroidia bacterium]